MNAELYAQELRGRIEAEMRAERDQLWRIHEFLVLAPELWRVADLVAEQIVELTRLLDLDPLVWPVEWAR